MLINRGRGAEERGFLCPSRYLAVINIVQTRDQICANWQQCSNIVYTCCSQFLINNVRRFISMGILEPVRIQIMDLMY